MVETQKQQSGCPGEEECPYISMNPNACTECHHATERMEIDPEAESFLDYAAYLFQKLEMVEANLPVGLSGLEPRQLLILKREKARMQAEIKAKQHKKENVESNRVQA